MCSSLCITRKVEAFILCNIPLSLTMYSPVAHYVSTCHSLYNAPVTHLGPDAHDIDFSIVSIPQQEGQLLEAVYDDGPFLEEDGFGRVIEG